MKIQITQEGIVEAFKQVKIPSEWKISISSQVDKKLNDFTETFMKQYQENEATKYLMIYLCLKILANTAAANKLSEEDKEPVHRARKIQRFLSQPFFVAEQFSGIEGKYVKIEDTIKGFKEIIEGKHDDLPEQAFYMVGTIEEAVEKAKTLQ